MPNLLKISEAGTLAMHTMSFLSRTHGRLVKTSEVVAAFHVSKAHLEKVMQRLVRAHLLKSVRGPQGGFTLARDSSDITLRDVYESIEGEVTQESCLFKEPVCGGGECLLGCMLHNIDRELKETLTTTRLSDLDVVSNRKSHESEKKDHKNRRGKV
jgi:Rrf2 family protein